MFGLFQTDIPIGRRLWVMILVFIVARTTSDTIFRYSQDPIPFAINILIYFGYVYTLSFFIMFIPGFIGQIIEGEFKRRKYKKKTYKSTVMPPNSNIWLEILANLSFVVATFISTSLFGSPTIVQGGIIGLSLLIIIEIFDFNLLYKETLVFLELRSSTKGKLIARVISDFDEQEFMLKSDFVIEMHRLIDWKWKLVDSSRLDGKSQAIFQRYIRTSKLSIKRSRTDKTKIKKQIKETKPRSKIVDNK